MNPTQKRRDAMIEKLYAEVEMDKLVVGMLLVFKERRNRAGVDDPDNFRMDGENIERVLDDFLRSCSMRQLRILRKIADGLTREVITDPQELEELDERKVDVVTEVVQPPTAH